MKQFITAAMVMACVGLQAQNIGSDSKIVIDSNYGLSYIPSQFTKEGKARLYTYSDGGDEKNPYIEILDENFDRLRTCNIPLEEKKIISSYDIIQERKGEVTVTGYDISQGFIDDVFTSTEDACAYLLEHEDYQVDSVGVLGYNIVDTYDKKILLEKGSTLLFSFSNDYYFSEEKYGHLYPDEFWALNKKGKLVLVEVDYDEKFNGEWEEREQMRWSQTVSPYSISFIDCDNLTSSEFECSQTLFNNDDLYEFLLPVYSSPMEVGREEYDQDDDGEIDYKRISYSIDEIGFKIVSENGSVLQTIVLDSKYNIYDGISLIKVAGKYFLKVRATENKGDGYESRNCYEFIYAITLGSTALRQIGQPIKSSVRQHDNIVTVETAPHGADRKLTVTDAGGRAVWSQTVPAGLSSVQIDASRFSKGVNIVSINGGKPENCKVIIR